MTIGSDVAASGPFYPDGVTVAFPFEFEVADADDLAAVWVSEDGTETPISSATYAVTISEVEPGGTVTFVDAPTLPAATDELWLYLDPAFEQQDRYSDEGAFNQSLLERTADNAVRLAISLKEKLGRALLLPRGSGAAALPNSSRANRFLGFDALGNPIYSAGLGSDAALRDDLGNPLIGVRLVALANGRTLADLVSTADETIYVRADGDDDAGDGSLAAPFASPQRAIDALPLLSDDRSYLIDIGPGTFALSNRIPLASGHPSMARTALLYIDRLRIGKRTSQYGASLSGSLVIKGAGRGVTILQPSATYPRGIYGTGNVGSVGLADLTVRAAAGAESLAVTHRGFYLHGRNVDLDGDGGKSTYGLLCEAGGKAEMIDCNATGSGTDIYAYPGGSWQFASPADNCTIGTIYSVGCDASCGQSVVVTGRARFKGGSFLASPSTVAGRVDFRGDCSFDGCGVEGPWLDWSGADRRLEFRNCWGNGDAWRWDAQMLLFNSMIEGNGHASYIQKINYDALVTAFVEGEVVTGGTSGATATVQRVIDFGGGTGTLVFRSAPVDGGGAGGPFQDNEALVGSIAGSATANGAAVLKSAHLYPLVLRGEGSQFSQSWDYTARGWRAASNSIIGSDGIQKGPAYAKQLITYTGGDPAAKTLPIEWDGNREIFAEVKNNTGGNITNMVLPATIPAGRNAGDRWPEGQRLTLFYRDAVLMTMLPGASMTLPYGASLTWSAGASHVTAATFVWVSSLDRWLCENLTQNLQSAPINTYVAPAGGATIDAEVRASLAQLAADVASLRSKTQAGRLHA